MQDANTMHPLAHLEHQNRTKRKRKHDFYLANIIGLILLFTTALALAPLFHEAAHISFLEIRGIEHISSLAFTLANGVTGTITPLESMTEKDTITLFGVGVFSNLLAGILILGGNMFLRAGKKIPESILATYLGSGFLYDPLSYCFAGEGDLVNILWTLGLSGYVQMIPLIGLGILAVMAYYIDRHSKEILSEYYVLKEEIDKMEDFLGLISARGSQRS